MNRSSRLDRRSLLAGAATLAFPALGGTAPRVPEPIVIAGVPFSLTTPQAASRARILDAGRTQEFTVNTGDRSPWDLRHGSFADRLELVADPRRFRVPYRVEFQWAFRMFVAGDAGLNGDWQVLAQIHHLAMPPSRIGVNPPLAVCWDTEGQPGFSVLCRSARSDGLSPTGYVKPQILYSNPAFPRRKWVPIGLTLVFSWEHGARAALEIAGNQVAELSGPEFRLGYEWDDHLSGGLYPQFGIYRASARQGTPWKRAASEPATVAFSDHQFVLGGKQIT